MAQQKKPSAAAPSPLLTLFLMTEKGFHLLKNLAPKYKGLFGLVVVGGDKTLQKDYEAEIIDLCVRHRLPYVRRDDFRQEITTKYAMAVSWRWLIDHPSDRLIVLHDSLLPRYRGWAPLVNSLINGEKKIGVSAIFGASEYDRGDIITQSASAIRYPIKIADAITAINRNYVEAAAFVFEKLHTGKPLKAIPQKESESSYSIWRDEMDYRIDWSQPAGDIRRFIDAVGFPYKGASTTLDGKLVRIFDAGEVKDVKAELRHCGKVLFVDKGKPVVICGRGLLKITHAEIEGGKKNASLFPLPKFRMRFI